MDKKVWKAFVGLAVQEKDLDNFLTEKLTDAESGELVGFDAGFPIVKEAILERMKSRRLYGTKQKGIDLSKHIATKVGIEPELNERVEKHFDRALEAYQAKIKSEFSKTKTDSLTREDLLGNKIVKSLLDEAKGDGVVVYTKEGISSSPVYQEMASHIKNSEKAHWEALLKKEQEELRKERTYRLDSQLKANIATFIDDKKINYNPYGQKEDDARKTATQTLFDLAKVRNQHGFGEINGTFYPLNSNGDALTGAEDGFPVPFDKFMLQNSPFRPHPNDPKKGGLGVGGQGGSAKVSTKGMSESEVMNRYDALYKAGKGEQAEKLMDSFEASQA